MRRTKPAPAPLPPLADRQRPGLSLTLEGPRDPRLCQACGVAHHPGNALARWLEHDEHDRLPARPVVVVLCEQCSGRLIDPHPRLYRRLDNGAPFAGCMSVCVRCIHRDGVACREPGAKVNDGPGLEMKWAADAPPFVAHLYYGGGRGELRRFYSGPVVACSGRRMRML